MTVGAEQVRTRRGIWAFPSAPVADLVSAAVHAEAAGFDEFWLGDEGPARDPFIALTAIAAATKRLRLGIAVTNPYLRHPLTTAIEAMTVDELSDGRMVLGMGPGGQVALGPVGVERVRPLAAVRAAIRLIRAVSKGEHTDGYAPPQNAFTRPGLEIYVGSRSQRFQTLASEVADGAFLGGLPASVIEQTVNWARAVRPIAISLYSTVVFDEMAAEHLRPSVIMPLADSPDHVYAALRLDRSAVLRAAEQYALGDPGPARRIVDRDVFAELVLTGTPQQVGVCLAERVQRWHPDSVGFTFTDDDLHAAIDRSAAAFHVLDQRGL